MTRMQVHISAFCRRWRENVQLSPNVCRQRPSLPPTPLLNYPTSTTHLPPVSLTVYFPGAALFNQRLWLNGSSLLNTDSGIRFHLDLIYGADGTGASCSPCSHVITASFSGRILIWPPLLARVTASGHQVRPLVGHIRKLLFNGVHCSTYHYFG